MQASSIRKMLIGQDDLIRPKTRHEPPGSKPERQIQASPEGSVTASPELKSLSSSSSRSSLLEKPFMFALNDKSNDDSANMKNSPIFFFEEAPKQQAYTNKNIYGHALNSFEDAVSNLEVPVSQKSFSQFGKKPHRHHTRSQFYNA